MSGALNFDITNKTGGKIHVNEKLDIDQCHSVKARR